MTHVPPRLLTTLAWLFKLALKVAALTLPYSPSAKARIPATYGAARSGLERVAVAVVFPIHADSMLTPGAQTLKINEEVD